MPEKDPYEAPKSRLDNSNQGDDESTNTLAWKVFFWITATLALLTVLGISLIENLTLFDYIDIVLSIITTVGLYGFAYYKPISILGKGVIFWRYFFYVVFVESLILFTILPILGIPIYGEQWNFDQWFLVNILYMTAMLYAVYQYAYRRPFIWPKK